MARLTTLGTNLSWYIRALTPHDAKSLLYIQAACYGPALVEDHAVFAQRLACQQQCSLGVERTDQPGLLAYLAAYYSTSGKITPLNGNFGLPDPDATQVLYLHDMSVLPEMAGQGLARHLLQTLFEQARRQGLQQAALVSVQGTQSFWEKNGFVTRPATNDQQKNLRSYGDSAVYMEAFI